MENKEFEINLDLFNELEGEDIKEYEGSILDLLLEGKNDFEKYEILSYFENLEQNSYKSIDKEYDDYYYGDYEAQEAILNMLED